MITKAIAKAVKSIVKPKAPVDPEFEQVKAQVNELDSLTNCIYFDRFAKTMDRTKAL